MKSSTFSFKDDDDIEIHVYKWEPDMKPKAIVQIIHGMAEYAKRYEQFAEFLCNDGYICYANDHRGHGRTAGIIENGTFKENAGILGTSGWEGMVNTLHKLSKIMKSENPNLPLFIFGHSWGSFMTQHYIQQWGSEIKGCILSGTNGFISLLVLKAGLMLAEREIKKIGPNAPSQKLDDLSFKAFNKKWKNEPNNTGFEWLSRDKNEVQKYVDDEKCGFICSSTFYLELLKTFESIWKKENEQKIPTDLPIHIFSGRFDPVGNNTKNVKKLINRYEEYGIKDISFKFYQDARHEMLNEINREEVFKDINDWLNSHV